MKVLVDECVPLRLVRLLRGHEFTTALEQGGGGFQNGRLLAQAEPGFDLCLTSGGAIQGQLDGTAGAHVSQPQIAGHFKAYFHRRPVVARRQAGQPR